MIVMEWVSFPFPHFIHVNKSISINYIHLNSEIFRQKQTNSELRAHSFAQAHAHIHAFLRLLNPNWLSDVQPVKTGSMLIANYDVSKHKVHYSLHCQTHQTHTHTHRQTDRQRSRRERETRTQSVYADRLFFSVAHNFFTII